MGISVVSTYVPWGYHEYKRGKFDFTGKTEEARNLKAFLQLAKQENFWVIIRPGPYIYSEWKNDGVPDYAYKYHRLHPTFLRYAEIYIKRVCKVLRPFLASHSGGNIIMLQADNEIDPWADIFGGQYGLWGKVGLFQNFIRAQYHNDITKLNDVWASDYSSFDEIGPYELCEIKGDCALKRSVDYIKFKHHYSNEVATWVNNKYRACRIDVPIYLNAYPFFYAHDWKSLYETCDLLGIDLYPENEFSVGEMDHRKMMDKVRYMRTFSPLPYIAEFASGIWHNHHYATGVITPNHYRLLTLSMLLAGLKGWNWYMLVNRDNWYMAPINEWGNTRAELFSVFKKLVEVFDRMKPHECTKVVDISVTFDALHYAAQTVREEETVLQRLYCADIDYDFFDARTQQVAHKILFYSGNQWVSTDDQTALLKYVKAGGVLVAFKNYPRKNDNFHKTNILGFKDPDRILFKFKRRIKVRLDKKHSFTIYSTIGGYNEVPGTPIKGKIDGCGEMIIGYLRSIGKGKILHLFIEPTSDVLLTILAYFKVTVPIISATQGLSTALFIRGKKLFAIMINNGNEEKSSVVSVNHPLIKNRRFAVKNLLDDQIKKYSATANPVITWEIPRKDGVVFEIKRLK
ncbi:MAG: beta-galactosidase [Candidatus Omnitrophica bacterium]|nr:beta-galactosidase [Candidatus Omnitrophota bacterium]